jgi:hypothetical protein
MTAAALLGYGARKRLRTDWQQSVMAGTEGCRNEVPEIDQSDTSIALNRTFGPISFNSPPNAAPRPSKWSGKKCESRGMSEVGIQLFQHAQRAVQRSPRLGMGARSDRFLRIKTNEPPSTLQFLMLWNAASPYMCSNDEMIEWRRARCGRKGGAGLRISMGPTPSHPSGATFRSKGGKPIVQASRAGANQDAWRVSSAHFI